MDGSNTTDREVTGIIAAFMNSLQQFKTYRERKRKAKKSSEHKSHRKLKDSSGDELLLSNSLRQGAVDVQQEYERHYRIYGDKYARGDAAAHSSLSRTLRKLNTCFHNIIAALLQKDTKIDYKYLTSVSDISRQEALETLSQLSVRMSMSAYSLQHKTEGDKHKRHKSTDSSKRPKLPSSKSASDVTSVKSTSKKGQPVVKKVRLQSSSSPQLAMVRPKPRRSGSGSSSPKSDVTATIIEIPALPELPANPTSKYRRKDSAVSMSPPLSPSPTLLNTPSRSPARSPPQRRRSDKITPSMHTMASASTRLGEIPELKWSIPYDHDAMIRLNKEHGGRPWPPPPEPTRPRRGFLSLFKKSDFKTAEVAA